MAKKKKDSDGDLTLIELEEIPERFKSLPDNKKLYLLKSKLSVPPKVEGYEHFGTGTEGFFYIK